MDVAIVIVAAVAALGAFGLLLWHPADPEKASSHEVDPPRGPDHQPGDGRPAGPDAESMRPSEGTAVPWPDDPEPGR
jgi:hypothetical protein